MQLELLKQQLIDAIQRSYDQPKLVQMAQLMGLNPPTNGAAQGLPPNTPAQPQNNSGGNSLESATAMSREEFMRKLRGG